jgi:hypothetical protein
MLSIGFTVFTGITVEKAVADSRGLTQRFKSVEITTNSMELQVRLDGLWLSRDSQMLENRRLLVVTFQARERAYGKLECTVGSVDASRAAAPVEFERCCGSIEPRSDR